MKKLCKYFLMLSISLTSVNSLASSPWLAPPGRLDLSLGFTQLTFDEFWGATSKRIPLAGAAINENYYLAFVYGISQRFAFDLVTGTGHATYAPGNRGDIGGRLDTDYGLLFRAIDEFTATNPYLPTVTFRAGGTIRGVYGIASPSNIQAPGSKVNGIQIAMLLGKYLPHNFALYGQIGYRNRNNPVPNAIFGNIGVLQTVFDHWTWSAYYDVYRSISGLDLGVPPFTGQIGRFGFQALKEEVDFINASLSYGFPHGQSVTLVYASAVRGRNTGVQRIASLFATFPIQIM